MVVLFGVNFLEPRSAAPFRPTTSDILSFDGMGGIQVCVPRHDVAMQNSRNLNRFIRESSSVVVEVISWMVELQLGRSELGILQSLRCLLLTAATVLQGGKLHSFGVLMRW